MGLNWVMYRNIACDIEKLNSQKVYMVFTFGKFCKNLVERQFTELNQMEHLIHSCKNKQDIYFDKGKALLGSDL